MTIKPSVEKLMAFFVSRKSSLNRQSKLSHSNKSWCLEMACVNWELVLTRGVVVSDNALTRHKLFLLASTRNLF